MKGSELIDPKAAKTTLSQTSKVQPAVRLFTDNSTLNPWTECLPMQHVRSQRLGKQQGARAVHETLTLHKSHTRFLVGTIKKRPPGDIQRARRRDIALGSKVPHDGHAEVSVRRQKGVTGVQMARVRPVLAPVTQSGSGASRHVSQHPAAPEVDGVQTLQLSIWGGNG
jgi:hypothetical protein